LVLVKSINAEEEMNVDEKNYHINKKIRVRGEFPPLTGWAPTNRFTTIPELILEFDYKVGAEIGVQRGEYTEVLFKKNPELKMYCIDPWTPYKQYPVQWKQDMIEKEARERLAAYNVEFIKKTSEEALKDIANNSLDFVYIDALHDFDSVMLDLIGWSRKVKSGGMISGHDFIYHHGMGVVPAVEVYARVHNINLWYITKESLPLTPSFFWVKR
jgi:hypothetical protein